MIDKNESDGKKLSDAMVIVGDAQALIKGLIHTGLNFKSNNDVCITLGALGVLNVALNNAYNILYKLVEIEI
jgi:hypothetical protein